MALLIQSKQHCLPDKRTVASWKKKKIIMYEFIYNYQASFGVAVLMFIIGGLLLLHGNARIRWYAFSLSWLMISNLNALPFYAETCVLIVAFIFAEAIFKMYAPSFLRLRKNADNSIK